MLAAAIRWTREHEANTKGLSIVKTQTVSILISRIEGKNSVCVSTCIQGVLIIMEVLSGGDRATGSNLAITDGIFLSKILRISELFAQIISSAISVVKGAPPSAVIYNMRRHTSPINRN